MPIPPMPNGACVRARRAARPLRPAAFLDGRGRHGRRGRYLASPSRNDKKARPPSHLLARSPARASSYAPLSLPELRRGIFKNPQNSRKPSEFEGNYETATDLMVHLPHRSRSNSLVVRSELSRKLALPLISSFAHSRLLLCTTLTT